MAYRPINKLNRVVKVQTIYRRYSQEGVTDLFIFEHYIRDEYNISMRTMYNWLAINVKQETKKLETA